VGSTSTCNLVLGKFHIPETDYFENHHDFQNPQNIPTSPSMDKTRPLFDLLSFGLSLSSTRKYSPFLYSTSHACKPITLEAKNYILQHLMENPLIPLPPNANPWVSTMHGTLRLPQNLHDMLENYLKILPKFDGESEISIEDHIASFQYCTNNLAIHNEYVYMRNFVQTLKGYTRKWFHNLAANSINSWDLFQTIFVNQWREKRDHQYYLT
jgi:hypothetical protein